MSGLVMEAFSNASKFDLQLLLSLEVLMQRRMLPVAQLILTEDTCIR
jgi:hypothetical protein